MSRPFNFVNLAVSSLKILPEMCIRSPFPTEAITSPETVFKQLMIEILENVPAASAGGSLGTGTSSTSTEIEQRVLQRLPALVVAACSYLMMMRKHCRLKYLVETLQQLLLRQ